MTSRAVMVDSNKINILDLTIMLLYFALPSNESSNNMYIPSFDLFNYIEVH